MLSLSDIVNVKVGIGRGVFEAPGATVIGGKKPSFNLEILKLFANNEQGFFYDPNDLSTMFQDAAGTIPVTAAGQPVGLLLDKSKGLALGVNIATATAPFTVYRDATTNIISPDLAMLVANKSYVVTAVVSSASGTTTADFRVNSNIANIVQSSLIGLQSGTFTSVLTAKSDGALRLFGQNTGVNFTVTSLSIRELKGNHAYQTASASRPIFRQKPILGSELVTTNTINGRPPTGTTQFYAMSDKMAQLSAGKTYNISYTVKDYTGTGNVGLAGSAPAGVEQKSHTTNGTYSSTHTPTANGTIVFYTSATNTANFSDISVKEVTGYRTDQNFIDYDGIDDKLITNLSAQLTGCTVIRSVPNVGTQILTGQTIPATYEDNKDHCGLIVINRALTPSETSAITSEFNKRAGV